MKKIDHAYATAAFFLFTVVLSIVLVFCYSNIRKLDLCDQSGSYLQEGWTYTKPDGSVEDITLPAALTKEELGAADSKSLTGHSISRVVDEKLAGSGIAWFSHMQKTSVSCGGSELYSWQNDKAPKWIRTYGWLLHIVHIPADAAGQTLTIQYTPDIKNSIGVCPSVMSGTDFEIENMVRQERGFQHFIAITVIVIGIFFMLAHFVFRKFFNGEKTVLMMGVLSIILGFWQLEESCLFYFMCSNPLIHWCLDYLIFSSLSLCFVSFAEQILHKENDIIFRILFWFAVVQTVVNFVLQFTGLVPYTMTTIGIHIVLVLTCLYIIICVVKGLIRHEKYLAIYIPAIAILLLGAVGEVIYYNITKQSSQVFLGLILVPFFIYIGLNVYLTSAKKFREAEKSEMYHQLAFKDYSTGVLSRTAFYDYIDNCAFDSEYTIYVFDLNNLKYINDNYGHQVGDRALKVFAECASSAFANRGLVYRVGGDEFVVLCRNPRQFVLEECERIYKALVSERSDLPVPLSASYGSIKFYPRSRNDFYLAQKAADMKMYSMKRTYHTTKEGDRRNRAVPVSSSENTSADSVETPSSSEGQND